MQAITDLELVVVCDGAPPMAHAIVDEVAAHDACVRAFKFDQGGAVARLYGSRLTFGRLHRRRRHQGGNGPARR